MLVLGATNAPWHLDSAFRRPGRFDRVMFVPPPDPEARRRHPAPRLLLAGKPLSRATRFRLAIAKKTDRFSGADLAAVVDKATQRRIAEALRVGEVRPLETEDLLAAARQAVPTTREWFATVRTYVTYANESGLYDAVRPYLR